MLGNIGRLIPPSVRGEGAHCGPVGLLGLHRLLVSLSLSLSTWAGGAQILPENTAAAQLPLVLSAPGCFDEDVKIS